MIGNNQENISIVDFLSHRTPSNFDENKYKEASAEERRRIIDIKSSISKEILEILKLSENDQKHALKKKLVNVLAGLIYIVTLGILGIALYYVLTITNNSNQSTTQDVVGLISILFTGWKLLSLLLEKMVDYTFTVDKTLINLLNKTFESSPVEDKITCKRKLFINIIEKCLQYWKTNINK
ncbi:MAG: hypothetical protein ACRCZO_20065 [Cetobacterium sp.]